jgi:isoleucyl-tRNA synthetase
MGRFHKLSNLRSRSDSDLVYCKDCHGLPVEFEIDKTEGIRSKQDVLNMGIDVYNEKCRAIVMRYSKEWEKVIKRLGRWIDFERDYKTMDPSFMESVWHVFHQLWEKELVYRGFKVTVILITSLK